MILTEKQQYYKHYNRVKYDKYEYLTAEEILPPSQKRVIEQAKFTYFPLGKAFENQIKRIRDQGEKQIKALEVHGKQLIKSSSEKESLLKEKEIFEELANKQMVEIQKLSKQINFNNLTNYFKGSSVRNNLLVLKVH